MYYDELSDGFSIRRKKDGHVFAFFKRSDGWTRELVEQVLSLDRIKQEYYQRLKADSGASIALRRSLLRKSRKD